MTYISLNGCHFHISFHSIQARQRHGGGDVAGRLLELLQLGDEPRLVRVPLGELQEELHEGVHLRGRKGSQRRASSGKFRELQISTQSILTI